MIKMITIVGAAVVILASALPATAQRTGKVWGIGYAWPGADSGA